MPTSPLAPLLAQQGLRSLAGLQSSLVGALCPCPASSLLSGRPITTNSSSNSSGMLLQQRHAAAGASAAPGAAGTEHKHPQRAPTRLTATSSRKARPGAGTSNSSSSGSGAGSAPAAVPKDLVLKAVPGIGKKYMERLQANGINSVDKLADNILKELSTPAEAFAPGVRYLQKLGINRKDHAQRIVKHITAKFDQDLHSRCQEFEGVLTPPGTLPLTLCVEGNISAGKSTFLQYITNNNEELQQQLGVVHEPVEDWQRVPSKDGSTLNLLDKFYQDPPKYAYTFQNYVFMSRVMQERNSANIQQPVRLMERSVFSDRMVFVRAVQESGWMGDVELAVYDSWFGPILDSTPSLVPDGFIYLKCTPNTCMERLKMRGRSEENTVSMDYLEGLHLKHEDWLGAGPKAINLLRSRRRDNRVHLPNGLLLPGGISDNLRDSLYVLDNNSAAPEMHTALNGVPALVLDVDRDVLRDLDLQRKVQDTVLDYIGLMRQHREQRQKQLKELARSGAAARSTDGGSGSGDSSGDGSRRRRSSARGRQQDAPKSVQQAIELVAGTASVGDFEVVPNSSGQLQEERLPVSGNLEALQFAVSSNSNAGSRTASATAV